MSATTNTSPSPSGRGIDKALASYPPPTTAEEFAAFLTLATGSVVIQFIHRDQRQLEAAARKRGVDPHDDPACAHLYIEWGNARFFPRSRRDKLTIRGWLSRADSEEWNTYFLPATRRRPVGPGSRPNSKPRKEHVRGARVFWVDLDPAPPPEGCTDLAAWNESQRAAILERLRAFRPEPSFIIDSGGGYQAFWILREEFAIDPDVRIVGDNREYLLDGAWTPERALAEAWRGKRIVEIECHLGALCEQLGGDSGTWNVERVMRMPFTWNNVDADKARRKGRVRKPTGIVEWHPERQYAIEEVPRTTEHPSRRVRDGKNGSGASAVAKGSGDLAGKTFAPHQQPLAQQLESFQPRDDFGIDDLDGAQLSDEALFVLQIGCAPREAVQEDHDKLVRPPGIDRNRECVRFAGLALRDGLNPQQIASLLMNSEYAASDHIRDQADPRRAAKRAVATAIEGLGAKPKPQVRLPGGAQDNLGFVRDMLPLLRGAGFYSRGGALLRVAGGTIELVDPTSAITEFEGLASFYELKPAGGSFKQVSKLLCETAARVALRSRELRDGLPEIKAFSKCALLLRSGKVLTGYDPETKVFAHGAAPPTMQVEDALRLLRGLLQDFQFATPEDEARGIVALLIPLFCFGKLLGPEARCPLLVVEADKKGTGKGTYCALLAALYNEEASIITMDSGSGSGVGSFKEQLADRILRAAAFVQIDNVSGKKKDTMFLESLLTERNVNCRVPYGGNVQVDPRGTFLELTANKAQLSDDLADRSLIFQLRKRPKGHAWRQWPEGGLIEHVKANQAEYLGALHTLGRAWTDAGCPQFDSGGHRCREWAGSARWIAMHLLGLADPVKGVALAQERVASPHLNWARDVALVVQGAGQLDLKLRTHDLLELLASANAEVPGVESADLDDQEARDKALMSMGRRFAMLFKNREVLDLDGLFLRRVESATPNEHGNPDRSYIVSRDPDASLTPEPSERPPF